MCIKNNSQGMLDPGFGWTQSLLNDSVSSQSFRHAKSSPSPSDRLLLAAHSTCLFDDVTEGSKARD